MANDVPAVALGRVARAGGDPHAGDVGSSPLPGQVRPIHSGVLVRRGGGLPAGAAAFLDFLLPAPADRTGPTALAPGKDV